MLDYKAIADNDALHKVNTKNRKMDVDVDGVVAQFQSWRKMVGEQPWCELLMFSGKRTGSTPRKA